MAEISRNTVLAITKETTEGTPVLPSAGTDAVTLQEGFTLTPSFDQLESAELQGSIGKALSVLGAEHPEASISHYMKTSGTEGTEPEFNHLLEAAFGTKVIASTQYDTVASSTAGTSSVAATIIVDTGEGVNFQRGQALLIKDGTNGYNVRNVFSVSSDTLTLGFNLLAAPALGVNLGKACLYKPADSGHPTLTLSEYRGNGGALEVIAGARVTQYGVDITAGDYVNQNFSLRGVGYYFDPINIAAADKYLDFTDDDGTFAAVVAVGLYKDPHDLASALQTAMNSANAGETHTVTYSDTTGKFTIKSTGTVLSLLWNSGTNTANTIGDKIGFVTGSDDSGTAAATGYTSDNAQIWTFPYTASYDTVNPFVAKANEAMIGDFKDYTCFAPSSVKFTLDDTAVDILSVCATSGISGSIISAREVGIDIAYQYTRHDADKFKRFRTGANIQFAYTGGEKSGGNWVAGKVFNIFCPTMTVNSFELVDNNGLVDVNLSLKAYVSSSLGEVYLNFL